ncbi:MAG: DUF2065 domain-containing protein [Alphaproteobacteria bacterium]
MAELLQALALVLVIEGVLYALFPGALKRIMIRALETPDGALRMAGLVACAIGVAAVWLMRS